MKVWVLAGLVVCVVVVSTTAKGEVKKQQECLQAKGVCVLKDKCGKGRVENGEYCPDGFICCQRKDGELKAGKSNREKSKRNGPINTKAEGREGKKREVGKEAKKTRRNNRRNGLKAEKTDGKEQQRQKVARNYEEKGKKKETLGENGKESEGAKRVKEERQGKKKRTRVNVLRVINAPTRKAHVKTRQKTVMVKERKMVARGRTAFVA
ncbi:hypothetical protein Pcinc_035055 [Petrolisthes cinctipes]|uniref:Uncharacterized protein n=1 Tax=Petrolisthes cinctipes TaxID=88211 RepID=A0AAE1EP26_PETCI|nr:hypothetical protein Pcinc_035055 [Petrolisthes cinctipes]